MQSGAELPPMPGDSRTPSPMPDAARRRLLIQPAQIGSWLARPVGKIILAMLVVVVLGGSVGGFFLVRSLVRHGLPDDIPLPDHSSFFNLSQSTTNNPHYGTDTYGQWIFTVSGMTLEQVATFYQSQLSSNGWQDIVGGAEDGITILMADKHRGDNPPQESLRVQAQPNGANLYLIISLDTLTG